MSYQGIMLDIETMGIRPGCSILSIGAVEFSENGLGKQYYDVISLNSCHQWGLTIEPQTALWWMEQSQEARDLIVRGKKVDLDIALANLNSAFKWKGKQVWCNGASFDFPILSAAYDAVANTVPWEYWAQMDFRTVKNLVPKDVYDAIKVSPTIKHSALADAVAQAETLIKLLDHLNDKKVWGKHAA